jgi:hypothetical protein
VISSRSEAPGSTPIFVVEVRVKCKVHYRLSPNDSDYDLICATKQNLHYRNPKKIEIMKFSNYDYSK